MKIIKVDVLGAVTEHEYCADTLCELIDPTCELVEKVCPRRLYDVFGMSNDSGRGVVMLVDEEGLMKYLPVNEFGSWLYGTDIHGNPIVGDVLFVGTEYCKDGIRFCGLPDDVSENLRKKIKLGADIWFNASEDV